MSYGRGSVTTFDVWLPVAEPRPVRERLARQNWNRMTNSRCEFEVPTSENEPRVPKPLPKAAGLLAVYEELGLL